jgi:hypothetical protein
MLPILLGHLFAHLRATPGSRKRARRRKTEMLQCNMVFNRLSVKKDHAQRDAV